MTAGEIVIVGPGWDGTIAQSGAWQLWFLGSNYARYLALTAQLDPAHRAVDTGKIVNDVAARLRPAMIAIDEKLATGRFPLAFAASDLAERNPLSSDFFLDLCRTVGLIEAARQGGRHFVAVDDAGFGHALADAARGAGLKVTAQVGRGVSLFAQGLRAHAAFLRGFLKERAALRRHRNDMAALADRKFLLMSWVEDNSAGADRFFGAFPQWLRDQRASFGWIGNPTSWVQPIDRIAAAVHGGQSAEPMALAGAFQGFGALLHGYGRLLAFPFSVKRSVTVEGVDIGALVRLFVRRELASARLVFASLWLAVADRMKRNGIVPSVLAYTYENQPWEKAMLAGFRAAQPDVKLVGVQHAPFAENYASACPSPSQWRDGTAPDLIVTIGTDFRERLIAAGAPAGRIAVGGALRFPGLTKTAPQRVRAGNGDFIVFVTCSMDAREAFELTYKAVMATAGIKGLRLLVNNHPMLEEPVRADIRRRVASLTGAAHAQFVDGPAQGFLNEADVVLYNSSGTSFEAVAAGVPVIYVESELTLDLDKMAGQGNARCHGIADLRGAIEDMMAARGAPAMTTEQAQGFLRRCFAAPSREFWLSLVPGAGKPVNA